MQWLIKKPWDDAPEGADPDPMAGTEARAERTVFWVGAWIVFDLVAWGAFTVGARTDDGKTRLELNLATLESAPTRFRSR